MNMKRILIIGAVILGAVLQIKAQDIKVTKFERNYTSLIGSMDAVYDISGEACAVIRFFVRDMDYEIEPNLGALKQEVKTGEIRLWVPIGTKRLTIRHQGTMPLYGYELPVTLEPKVTYDVYLEMMGASVQPSVSSTNYSIYAGVGFNVMPLTGPTVSLGADINHHIVELSATYGLKKTDDWYYYSNGDVVAAYNYQAFRLSLAYGYAFEISDYISIVPQIGGACNVVTGKSVISTKNDNTYNNASSISAFGAVRLMASFSDNFKVHITPEYDFGVSKSDVCKLISDNDKTYKSWTDGLSLSAGLLIYF